MNRFNSPQRQQTGAALVTALVLLTIVTLLALTSMGTNTLEEKMAANSQETNRAFQTAETGLAKILDDDNAFDTTNSMTGDTTFTKSDDVYDYATANDTVGSQGETDYNAVYRQKTIPKRGSGWDTGMAFYHFDLAATGRTNSGVTTTLHAGAYQVGKK